MSPLSLLTNLRNKFIFFMSMFLAKCPSTIILQAKIYNLKKAINYYSARTAQIEIVRDKTTMEEIVFPIPEICRFLTEETKKTTFFETEMDDKDSKIADFFDRSESMYREMAWQEKLQAYPTLNWVTRRISTWDRIAFLLAIIMNFIVAFFYPFDDEKFPWDSSYVSVIFLALVSCIGTVNFLLISFLHR